MLIKGMMTLRINLITFVLLLPLTASALPEFDQIPTLTFADHIHLLHAKDPVDGGWLPDLMGLPDQAEVDALTQHAFEVMNKNQDKSCTSMNIFLRQLIFQHFVIYQQMANAQGSYFDAQVAGQWAHILGMINKESGGDSTNIMDMSNHEIATYRSNADLKHWEEILSLTLQSRVKLNYQTNFGLSQTSADRLFMAIKLADTEKNNTTFLEGKEGVLTPGKQKLNTAIAIRRLIWFYQDFAQGRITQSDMRIHERDLAKPEFYARSQAGLKMALLYCGTHFMFRDGKNSEKLDSDLQDAMASIAYCKFGNATVGYGQSEFDEKCFASWVTLCPALNIDIATLTPLSYFATRNVNPVCEETFKQLLVKKPANLGALSTIRSFIESPLTAKGRIGDWIASRFNR